MPTVRTAGTPNHHHQAQCSPTLELMESIAATIPGATEHARYEAWVFCASQARFMELITKEQMGALILANPYQHASEQDTEAA